MHIETRGHGPALVLIHGWAMHSGIFAPLAERLTARFTLHLVDLPGHGRSPERAGRLDLADLARRIAEATPPALWLGWSLGGLVALQAALAQPWQARGLIMLCASPRFVAGPDWPQGVEASVFRQFGDGLRADYRATIDRFLALEAHGSDHMREELRRLREHVFERGEPAPQVLHEGLRLLDECDLRDRLPDLGVPSLWIAGRRDRLVNWQAMQAAATWVADARFLRIDGGGHAPFLTHQDEIAAAIESFAAEFA